MNPINPPKRPENDDHHFSSNGHPMTRAMTRLRDQLTDVQIQVGKHKLGAHRYVLASASPHFENIFLGDYPDREQSVVTIGGDGDMPVDPEVFPTILDYIYGEKITFTPENAQTLCVAAYYLGLAKRPDNDNPHFSSDGHPMNRAMIRLRDQLTDVEIQVGEHKFAAHRYVLASASSYFENIFLGDFRDREQSVVTIGRDDDMPVDPVVFPTILNYIYGEKITFIPETAQTLCVAAHYLGLAKLVEDLDNYLTYESDIMDDIPTAFTFARHYDCKKLQNFCHELMAGDTSSLEKIEILELSFFDLKEFLTAALPYFSTKNLVFIWVFKWIDYKKDEREVHAPELFKICPLKYVQPVYLTETLSKNPLLIKDPDCLRMIIDRMKYLKKKRAINVLKLDERYTFFVADGLHSGIMQIPLFDHHGKGFSMGFIGKVFYTFGGTLKEYLFLDFTGFGRGRQLEWEDFATFPAHHHLGLDSGVIHDGNIYVAGNGSPVLERYTPERGIWESLKPMITQRSHFKLFGIGKYLYAIGGEYNSEVPTDPNQIKLVNEVERYDIENDCWQIIGILPKMFLNNKYSYIGVAHGDKLYVSNQKELAVFDTVSGSWTDLPSIPLPACAMFVSDGFPIAVCKAKKNKQFQFYQYDPENETFNIMKLNDCPGETSFEWFDEVDAEQLQ